MQNLQEQEILGVLNDINFSSENHINSLCRKVHNKLFVLSSVSAYLKTDKLKLLMKAFVASQIQYCPLAWTLHQQKDE